MSDQKIQCPHNKTSKYNCKLCYPQGFCVHEKRKYSCITCNASILCIHQKRKQRCIECDGSAICIHKKRKEKCKECDGSAICLHGKQKYSCKECGGSGICKHNIQKQKCIECGSLSICIHKKRKDVCIECDGSSICIHKKQKQRCVECNGSAICIHKKRKELCKDCNGSRFCKHMKQKHICKDCGTGSSLCSHMKRKHICKECGTGSSLCSHNILKSLCKEHGGKDLCKEPLCETRKNKKYILFQGYCTYCFIHLFPNEPITRNYKTQEKCVIDHIKEIFPKDDWKYDKTIVDGCSRKRPDALLDMGSHLLIVEVDEHRHSTYDCSCENKRLMQLSLDVGHRSIVFLRFNPDGNDTSTSCWSIHKKNGILYVPAKKEEEWNKRLQRLTEQITYWKENKPEKMVEIIELFY